jgi:hypothetical protein
MILEGESRCCNPRRSQNIRRKCPINDFYRLQLRKDQALELR